MKKNEMTCTEIAVKVGILLLFGIFLWQKPPNDGASGDWAAWIQAFGSIAAVIGSAVVAFKIADRGHRMERYRAAESALAISEALCEEAKKIITEFDKDYDGAFISVLGVYNKTLCEALVASLDKIPVHELPRKDFVSNVVSLQQRWHYFLWALDRFQGGVRAASGYKETYDFHREHDRLDDESLIELPNQFKDQTKKQIQLALDSSEKFRNLMAKDSTSFL